MSWSTLVAGLSGEGIVANSEGTDRISVTFTYDDSRVQKVIAQRVSARDLEWCEFLAAVGSAGKVQPAELLAINARTTLGGICFQNGLYLLRYVTLLGPLGASDFAQYLRLVAGRADAIERSTFLQDQF